MTGADCSAFQAITDPVPVVSRVAERYLTCGKVSDQEGQRSDGTLRTVPQRRIRV